MHRMPILTLLKDHTSSEDSEKEMLVKMIDFIEQNADCFERSLLEGHVTGSAWIVNPERSHTLLIHHVKLDKWLQPGGHCDGDADVLRVALKEVDEETGLAVQPLSRAIFDVDNHFIPERGDVPRHTHYDIRFLVAAEMKEEELPGNREVRSIRWIGLKEVYRYSDSESILRLVRKTMRFPA